MTALRVGRLNGRTYVCARCAREDPRFRAAGGFDLASFALMVDEAHGGRSSRMGCPECGTSLADVVTGSRMGCPVCYERFGLEIESALVEIHGSSVHRGKTPC